jgi:hypothetical protein
MSVEAFWIETTGTTLRQGDYVPRCLVPVFASDLAASGTHEIMAEEYDLIVLTQSCDLARQGPAGCRLSYFLAPRL